MTEWTLRVIYALIAFLSAIVRPIESAKVVLAAKIEKRAEARK